MKINVIEHNSKHNYKVGMSDDGEMKFFTSPNANYIFNLKTGTMHSWGRTMNDDPGRFPVPNILDMEVTTICSHGCSFCFPEGTKITMSNGTLKNIEDVSIGDKVKSYDTSSMNIVENEVLETYERNYDGIIVTLELADGTKLSATENHTFYVKGKGWVEAKNLTEEDEIIYLN